MLPPPSDAPDSAALYLTSESFSHNDEALDEAAGGDGPERTDDDRSTDIDDILWWSTAS
jgi:hypothetical protein